MRIIEDHQAIGGLPKGMVLTIGNFDGVHRGHQAIITNARQIARDNQTQVAVMTFDPHPAVLLNPERAPGILTPLKMKSLLLESFSVDVLIVIKDSLKLLNLSPEAFVDQFLMENLAPSVMVEGPDFNFGYGRSGDVNTLREFGKSRNFDVVEVPFVDVVVKGEDTPSKCSSSAIRSLLQEGSPRQAAQILGRPFRLVGKTIPGRGVGGRIGFPTANIEPIGQVIPAEGVYAGYVVIGDCLEDVVFGGLRRLAAISIGRAKTFVGDHPLLLEAHLLEDKIEDLRDKWLGLDFMRFVRHQQRFESKECLQKQIKKDCDKVLNYLI
ncbi:MAG: riboflavin biosynthesis protein RibF [Planctomycetota bacterium]|jgi:riboflavin kinase/FMN adenylyltransferase